VSIISLKEASFLASQPLFSCISLVIGKGDRFGLVARNGGGKSTFLKCLAGSVEPTAGSVIRSRSLRIGFVEQDLPANLHGLGLAESLRRAIAPEERESRAWRVELILDQFEAPDDLRQRPLSALSGGWQRLALIARAWLADPDILLLDEPTNHLDLDKMRFLESLIATEAGDMPMVIASHDRRFLDTCTNRTLFLRPERSVGYAHPYSRARRLLAEDDAAQAAKLARSEKEAARLRQSAGELRNIGINSRSDAAQKKSAQLARRADAIEAALREVATEQPSRIRLADRGFDAHILIGIDDVAVHAPDGRLLFRTGKLAIARGERVVILGRNGVGKSQFIGFLRRAIGDAGGVPGIRVHPSVVLGYLDQQMSQLPGEETLHGFISATFRLGDQRSLSLLAGAGFAMMKVRRKIAELSPGEKAQLGLLTLRLAEPNLYVMDEPTNHVDIPGQEKLEAEILEHETTCILVSHDRDFAAAIGTRYLLIEKGRMREVDGAES